MTVLQRVLIALVRAYQLVLSPWMGRQCRFTPSCSHYAIQAIEMHGAGKGAWLTLRRILRCHPFHPGGHDPVPEREASEHVARCADVP